MFAAKAYILYYEQQNKEALPPVYKSSDTINRLDSRLVDDEKSRILQGAIDLIMSEGKGGEDDDVMDPFHPGDVFDTVSSSV